MRRLAPAFTLIEVLIALAVGSVVLTGAYSLLSFGARTTGRAGDAADAVDSIGTAIVEIGARLRWCHEIVSPGGGASSPELEYSSFETGAWTLSVKDGSLILQEKHGFRRKVLAQGIASILFRRDDVEDGAVRVELSVGSGASAKTYRTVFFARGTRRPPWS